MQTQTNPASANADADQLRQRWAALHAQQPRLRPRDAAAQLGVSEAELVALRCGDGVQRLRGPWGELLQRAPELGSVMVLTRNESAVHEKVGCFGEVSVSGPMGLVLTEDIDLRIFLQRWHSGFAVTEDTRSGIRHSLQFFDVDGMAVHKIYLREDSSHDAYRALTAHYLHDDQAPRQEVQPRPPHPADRPDADVDCAMLRRRWQALQDTHEFHPLLHELRVGRVQALRLVGSDYARPVEVNAFCTLLERAAAAAVPVMVFVGSPGVIQIHTGPVSQLKQHGPWFNGRDAGFNLHLRQDHVAEAWLVRKPSRDGIVTSLEIYNAEARQIAWMFGKRKPGEPERDDWRELAATLEQADS